MILCSFFQAIYELYQGEVDLIEDLNIVKKVKLKKKRNLYTIYTLILGPGMILSFQSQC